MNEFRYISELNKFNGKMSINDAALLEIAYQLKRLSDQIGAVE